MNLFGWDVNFFMNCTPNFWLKQFIFYLRRNNPEAFEFEQNDQIYTMDQTPFFN
ncbi:hypothetical protein D928_02104 [Enterococcus faecalis 20-SD-BW-06]|nr:hypothetical protein D928_02104 [Enterococcus faecalis 20-SD-BW-06]EPI02013.1 hypothetical protein D919_01240 [Enterococcus faecalis 20-SD-BW-08]